MDFSDAETAPTISLSREVVDQGDSKVLSARMLAYVTGGRKALEDVAATARPDTILGWYRKLVANKFDGSGFRRRVGRPRTFFGDTLTQSGGYHRNAISGRAR